MSDTLPPLQSRHYTCTLSQLYKFDEVGIYNITVNRDVQWFTNKDQPSFTVVSNVSDKRGAFYARKPVRDRVGR